MAERIQHWGLKFPEQPKQQGKRYARLIAADEVPDGYMTTAQAASLFGLTREGVACNLRKNKVTRIYVTLNSRPHCSCWLKADVLRLLKKRNDEVVPEAPGYLPVDEACQFAGRQRLTLIRWANKGLVRTTKVIKPTVHGPKYLVHYHKVDLEKTLKLMQA